MKTITILLSAIVSVCTSFAASTLDPSLMARGFTTNGGFEIQVQSGPLQIEYSNDLQTWHHLTNGRDTVVDNSVTNAEWRYYRTPGVSNIIGFVRVPVEPGKSVLVAQPFRIDIHFEKPAVRKLIFGTEAPPVQISTLKNGKQTAYGYDDLEKNFMPTPPPIPWGEGFFVRNDGKQRIYVRFWGQLPQGNLKHPIAKGENVIAPLVPKPGPVHDAAGAKGIEGAQLLIWDEQKQSYQASTFNKSTGRWDPPLHYKPGHGIVAKYPEASTQAAMVLPSLLEKSEK